MNVISLEFNFADFVVTKHCQNVHVIFNFTETVHICEIRKINPTQNLRLLQYVSNKYIIGNKRALSGLRHCTLLVAE